MKDRNEKLSPVNVLTHPIWLSGLIVLLVNDHFLKFSEYAGITTGKLSDFAGLMVAPILLAILFRVKTNRGIWIAAAATGVVFSAINVIAPAAAVFDAMVSTIIPFHTTVDPTDLVALIAIPISLRIYRRTMLEPTKTLNIARIAIAGFGLTVCVATSMEPVPCSADSDCEQFEECLNEVCELKPTPCDGPADCNDGWACQQNVCRIVSSSSSNNDAMIDMSIEGEIQSRTIETTQPGIEAIDQLRQFQVDRAIDVCSDPNRCTVGE